MESLMPTARSAAALLVVTLIFVLADATPVSVSGASPRSLPEHPTPPPPGHRISRPTDKLLPDGHPGMLPTSGVGPFLTRPYRNFHAVTSVFDHCNPDYTRDGRVCAFDGSVASQSNGVDPGFSAGYAVTPGGSDYLYYDGHNGWDLALNYEPVLAAAPGTVAIAGTDSYNSGFGNTITIDHGNGFTTRYAHLSQISVQPGQSVGRGQQIGVSGNSGNSTGPHLHFGLYITNPWTAIDPWGWSGSGPDPWPADSGDYWLTGDPQDPLPSAPTSVIAAGEKGLVRVSWNPPSYDGGSPVTSYAVTSSPGGVSVTVGGGATSAQVSGLRPGITYSFTVSAVNAAGGGPASAASNGVVPAPDGSWENLGGTLTSAPASASWAPGRQDVFVRGTDNALWHRWWEGSGWSVWESLGGVLRSDPAAAARGPGLLDVFVRGTDDALWHKRWDGSHWSDWIREGGTLTSGPAAAAWDPSRLDVFVRGTDNALWHRGWDGAWGAWESWGGILTSGPAAASWQAKRLDVFVRGTDNALWHSWSDQGQRHPWESGGGILSAGPAAASPAPNQLDVLVLGSDNKLYRRRWLGSWWTAWSGSDGGWTSAPAASSQKGSLTVDIFESDVNRALQHALFNE
jgi:murein DD-endopeptidase MepM/ murein hydrolase activator NlpD